jgi:type I restriction enzyme S subunit
MVKADCFRFRLTPGSADPVYMALQLSAAATALDGALATGTTRLRMNLSSMAARPVLVPPLDEQNRIARFIADQTERIDALIAKKRELIDRLEEKRSGLISRTVTRGLPPEVARAAGFEPNPRLEASGVEWLGKVPEHWRVGYLRRFAAIKTGHTPSRSEPSLWEDCDIPWFTLGDVWQLRDARQIYLGATQERISAVGLANSAAELLPAGTVVLSRTASVGYSGIMPTRMATSQDFWNWVPGPMLLSEYLLFLLRAMQPDLKRLTMGSTHKTIYQPDAARLSICVPPLREQREIVDFLQSQTTAIDGLVAKIAGAIERLHEYRTALITAAVTGKIDVREHSTSLAATEPRAPLLEASS